MISPPSTASVDPARIGKLVRLLSSDRPGEAGAAAAALNRTLEAGGLDIHSFADLVEAALPKQPEQTTLFPSTAIAPHRSPRGTPLRIGDRLVCHEESGIFKACRCGSLLIAVSPGVGPHLAQLVCEGCGAKGRWLSRFYMEPPP